MKRRRVKTRARKATGARRAPTRRRAATRAAGPIQHVVLLIMENRSFDHMLGALQQEIQDLDGVLTADGTPRTNSDLGGALYQQRPGASRRVKPDPMHEGKNVLQQLEADNGGFVADYGHSYPQSSRAERQEVMAYHDVGTLPALHELARHFTVCDRWFCSVPGPTWPNRLFALSGTSRGRIKMPTGIFDLNLHRYQQDTIFDRLAAAKRSWHIYFGDFPLALLFEHERGPGAAKHYFDIDQFAAHAAGDPARFPDFAFIEPRYLPPGTDDDHPPHDVLDGQRLLADVYNAIRANDALWESTLLVVAYDEHGGFYDHVAPGAAVSPDAHQDEYSFDRYGVRVPALLISPWVDRTVVHDVFDHTSVLRYLIDLWSLGRLGKRTSNANSIAGAIRPNGGARADTPAAVMTNGKRGMARRAAVPAPKRLTELQQAIVSLSQLLEKETKDVPRRRVTRSMRLMEGPAAQATVAEERARRFLRQRGARV